MLRETFNFILDKNGHQLTHTTTAEKTTSPQEKLGTCLYRLSRGNIITHIIQLQKWQGVHWQLCYALLNKIVKWFSVTFFVSFSGFSERAEHINLVPSTSFYYKRNAKKEVKFALGTRLRSNINSSFTDRA